MLNLKDYSPKINTTGKTHLIFFIWSKKKKKVTDAATDWL